jgi:hypothetical protein
MRQDMTMKKAKGLLIVHDDEAFWYDASHSGAATCLLKVPLDQALSDGSYAQQIPKSLKGNHKTLCVVPDHWFGSETYPFRSTKPSLVEPFLERKLRAAYPDRQAIHHFFHYRSIKSADGTDGLSTYFLQDSKSFQLYSSLERMNLAPGRITSPGFLWEDKLARISAEFRNEGTLLIHLSHQMCLLYFYFQGNFLFSRDVVLPDSADSMNALVFEVNQSLYMFSQKTKNELSRIYFLSNEPESLALFSETFGRDIIDLLPLLDSVETVAMPDLPRLDGLIKQKDLSFHASYFSVVHRGARQELEWKPVQWAGILIGALLVLPLFGENLLLGNIIRQETAQTRIMRQQSMPSTGLTLADYETEANRVLEIAQRPSVTYAMDRVLKILPATVDVKEIEVSLEGQPMLKLQGVVQASEADDLKALLSDLVRKLRASFAAANDFSINDIDIQVDPSGAISRIPQYMISFQVALT